jgi:16S rRNA (uracil1498-N3)-methyltransferase
MTGAGPPAGPDPHVLIADLDQPVLDEAALHHLQRVRRLRPGDRCTVTDGAGAWRECHLGGQSVLEVHGPVQRVERPGPEITVAFALTKGVKPDWTVQKLTELGVDRIVPFRADHSIVVWDSAKAAVQLERLRAIARGAVEQSHQCWLPVVEAVTDVAELAGRGAARLDRGGEPPSLQATTVAVGPEGGWSASERRSLPRSVALGTNVLRAETAAVTAGAILVSLRSGLVVSAGSVDT